LIPKSLDNISQLKGTGYVGSAGQGMGIALSADGNMLLSGGYTDGAGNEGATWFFTRINGVWSQSGAKVIGTGLTGSSFQGFSVALSKDGLTAVVGGVNDNGGEGGVWFFIP
jgi:hypothetical protein